MRLRDVKGTTFAPVAVVVIAVFSLAMFAFLAGCGSSSTSTPSPSPTPPAMHFLVVTDAENNRVLIYDSSFTTDESASVVLGQSDFTMNGTGLTAVGMNDPQDTAEDSVGNLYVSDGDNHRVLQFKPPFTNGMSASLVIGQPDFATGASNVSQNGLNLPCGLAFDSSGNLWVADANNNRILQYEPPFATNMNASLVLGQPNFTTNTLPNPPTQNGFYPSGIAFDVSGDLWVTDGGNMRVLEFKPPFADGMAASLVIGQTDFVSSGSATTASGLSFPDGVAFDSVGNLWIGDQANFRILQFKPPFANGMSASLVLGQASFTTNTPPTPPTQNGFSSSGIAFDGSGNLYVPDYANSRTLQFAPPFSSNQNASLVIGQANFTSGAPATTATGQNWPIAVTLAP